MTTMTDEERAAAIARVTFIMPGLTDEGLGHLLERAEGCAALMSRDLSSGTLAAEQAARHGLLADAEAVVSKARRERTHGLNCDCGACTSQTAAMQAHDAERADLHDSASDAAAVLGSTGLDVASVGDAEGMRTLAAVGETPAERDIRHDRMMAKMRSEDAERRWRQS